MGENVDRIVLKIQDRSHYEATFNVWSDSDKSIPAYIRDYTALMEFRDKPEGTLLFSASTDNYMTVNQSSITISIPSAVVTAWDFKSAQFDIFVISPTSKPSKVVRGTVIILPSITEV